MLQDQDPQHWSVCLPLSELPVAYGEQAQLCEHWSCSGCGRGEHSTFHVELAVVGAGGDEAALFAAQGATSAVSELVFRRESNGLEYAFTEGTLADPGWTRLPSGLIMKWGSVTSDGSKTFNVAQTAVYGIGPAFTAVYSVQITPRATGTATGAQYNTFAHPLNWTSFVASFTYLAGERTSTAKRQTTFTYLAIGK